jgi:hypothetical protein
MTTTSRRARASSRQAKDERAAPSLVRLNGLADDRMQHPPVGGLSGEENRMIPWALKSTELSA